MKVKILRSCNYFLVAAGLFAFTIQFARASDASRVSGSYHVVQKMNLGSQTRVRLQLRLTNHGQHELRIQRLTLWDFSHPDKGGTHACSIVVHAGASADTTQEFTVRRPEYELWVHRTRPRLVLEAQSPDGRRTTKVVRLEPVFGRKAD